MLDKENEFKFKVLDDDTIIFLSVKVPYKSYEPSSVIVTTLSDVV